MLIIFLENFLKNGLNCRINEDGYLGGTVPAYGIYLRHLENVIINNVNITTINKDVRPVIMAIDVKNLTINGRKIMKERIENINN